MIGSAGMVKGRPGQTNTNSVIFFIDVYFSRPSLFSQILKLCVESVMLLEYYQKNWELSKYLRGIKNSQRTALEGSVGPTVCESTCGLYFALNIHASSKALWKFKLVCSPSFTIIEYKNLEGSMCNII